MSPCYPFRPIPGQCGPHRRGPLPAPPFDPQDYWATRKLVSSLFGSLETTKLDKVDVVDPSTATEDGKAADAKSTYEELTRISRMASDARVLVESKADLVGGKVPAAQLPSYVDDVLEYDTVSAFPAIGESGKIYVAKDANKTYRWSGTQYIEISQSPILDDTVTEKSPNGVKSSGIWSAIWGTLAALPAGFTSIYDWCADKIKAIEESLAGLDKSKLDANKGLNFAPSKYSEYNAVEIVNGWWLAVIGGFGNIWDVTSDGRMRQSLSSALNGKADKLALNTHVLSNENPHGVTAKQIGAVPLVEDSSGNKTAVTIGLAGTVGQNSLANGDGVTASGECSHAEGEGTTASGNYSHSEGTATVASGTYSHAEGESTHATGYRSRAEGLGTTASGYGSHASGKGTTASGDYSHADGVSSQTIHTYSYTWSGDELRYSSPYQSHGEGTYNINPIGGLDGFYIGEQTLYAILTNKADKADMSSTNPTFSSAVLAVNVDFATNTTGAAYVAVTNALAGFGFDADALAELPGGKVYGSIGALLAALAAAAAWLKKNKVQTLKLEDGSVETSADGGVAKLDNFFTESNSLLVGTIKANAGGDDEKTRAVFSTFARMDDFTTVSDESDSFDIAITKLSQLLGENVAA